MKKVLSVLMAAAMVMGMSVSAMAVDYSVPATVSPEAVKLTKNITWGNAFHHDADGYVATAKANSTDDFELEEGDVIYFEIINTDDNSRIQKLPSNWTLKINDAEYVEDAEFVMWKDKDLMVKVTLADDFDAKDIKREDKDEMVEFWMYIKDNKFDRESEKATIHFNMDTYDVEYLCESEVADVVDAEADVLYTLCNGKNNEDCTEACDHKSAMVVFDFGEGVLVKSKLYRGDKYLVKDSTSWKFEKELSKKYDTEVDVVTFNTELDVREVIFESAKDNKQVVAVVDGALVAVEDTEFVTKYEIIEDVELTKGYVAKIDANEGVYALVDADLEVEAEAEVEADKANPETGAADFVGAAVAMAVVSVAAAGALALKK